MRLNPGPSGCEENQIPLHHVPVKRILIVWMCAIFVGPCVGFGIPITSYKVCTPKLVIQFHALHSGTWCSGITTAQHAGGPGFNPQCVHASDAPATAVSSSCNRWVPGNIARKENCGASGEVSFNQSNQRSSSLPKPPIEIASTHSRRRHQL